MWSEGREIFSITWCDAKYSAPLLWMTRDDKGVASFDVRYRCDIVDTAVTTADIDITAQSCREEFEIVKSGSIFVIEG